MFENEEVVAVGFVILGLLITLGPQTMYSLNKAFQAGPSLFYSGSFGGLSSALRRLAEAGHVTVTETTEHGRHKRIHTITEAGIAAFHEWMDSPLDGELEIAALSRVFHLGLIEDPERRRQILERIVTAAKKQLAELEQLQESVQAEGAQLPPEWADVFYYQSATLDYGIHAHRAALSWFTNQLKAVKS